MLNFKISTNCFRGDEKFKFFLNDDFWILDFFWLVLILGHFLNWPSYPNLNFLQNVVLHQKCPTLSADSWTLTYFFWKIGKKIQVNNYEIVVTFFFISAITWHDIQQLSINLPGFTQFVQLINWQNNSYKGEQDSQIWMPTCDTFWVSNEIKSWNFQHMLYLLFSEFSEASQNLSSFRQLLFSLFHRGTKGKNSKKNNG